MLRFVLWSEIGKGHRQVKKNNASVEIDGMEECEADPEFIAMCKKELQIAFETIYNDYLVHCVHAKRGGNGGKGEWR